MSDFSGYNINSSNSLFCLDPAANITPLIYSPEAFTHNGTFHADDILSSALLLLFNPDLKICRTDDPPEKGLVFDIGGGRYDHHTIPLKKRPNGVPYAALGLLYKDLSPFLFSSPNLAEKFDEAFISVCDKCDNSFKTNPLQKVLSLFNPTWEEDTESDQIFNYLIHFISPILGTSVLTFSRYGLSYKFNGLSNQIIGETVSEIVKEKKGEKCFHEKWDTLAIAECLSLITDEPENVCAFLRELNFKTGKYHTNPFLILMMGSKLQRKKKFYKLIIKRKIASLEALNHAYFEAERQYKGGHVLYLEKYVPTSNFTKTNKEIKYIVYPSARGDYSVMCVGETNIKGKHISRASFPEILRGKNFSGREDGIEFVHSSGHLAKFCSYEKAMEYTESHV